MKTCTFKIEKVKLTMLKIALPLIITVILSSTIAAQEMPVINIGAGLPVLLRLTSGNDGSTHTLNGFPLNLSVEKPFKISAFKNAKLSVSPGIGYFNFHEYYESGGLGGKTTKNYRHRAVSVQSKFLVETFSFEKTQIQLGAIAGVYLASKTQGKESWWLMQQYPDVTSGEREVSRSGKAFFHPAYYGLLSRFSNKTGDRNSRLTPVFELSFYPGFATPGNQKVNMGMFSVVLGFNSKK
ncbi:MAG: hypothetical protein EOM73_12910 [Bacteroidia bacterium]|nr:hypothetical protein [Bacteroidia bacterium]